MSLPQLRLISILSDMRGFFCFDIAKQVPLVVLHQYLLDLFCKLRIIDLSMYLFTYGLQSHLDDLLIFSILNQRVLVHGLEGPYRIIEAMVYSMRQRGQLRLLIMETELMFCNFSVYSFIEPAVIEEGFIHHLHGLDDEVVLKQHLLQGSLLLFGQLEERGVVCDLQGFDLLFEVGDLVV